MANKTAHNKKELLQALEKTRGIVTSACEMVKISRSNYYTYIKQDAVFKEAVEELSNVALDFAESKLMQKMNGVTIGKVVEGETVVYEIPPSDTALIFYLKTKGKKRGYIERQELAGVENQPLVINVIPNE